MKTKITYQQAAKFFEQGRISKEQFESIYQEHHRKLKEQHEEGSVKVVLSKTDYWK